MEKFGGYMIKIDSCRYVYKYPDFPNYDLEDMAGKDREIIRLISNNPPNPRINLELEKFITTGDEKEHTVYICVDSDPCYDQFEVIRSVLLLTNFGSIYCDVGNYRLISRKNTTIPKPMMDILVDIFGDKIHRSISNNKKLPVIVEKIEKSINTMSSYFGGSNE